MPSGNLNEVGWWLRYEYFVHSLPTAFRLREENENETQGGPVQKAMELTCTQLSYTFSVHFSIMQTGNT